VFIFYIFMQWFEFSGIRPKLLPLIPCSR